MEPLKIPTTTAFPTTVDKAATTVELILVLEETLAAETTTMPHRPCDAAEKDCISMAKLQSHNSQSDCWVALHGNIYDLTSYANCHPGGAHVMTNLAGTDGTSEY
jgi:cytochrome b involved in lipid metabolism